MLRVGGFNIWKMIEYCFPSSHSPGTLHPEDLELCWYKAAVSPCTGLIRPFLPAEPRRTSAGSEAGQPRDGCSCRTSTHTNYLPRWNPVVVPLCVSSVCHGHCRRGGEELKVEWAKAAGPMCNSGDGPDIPANTHRYHQPLLAHEDADRCVCMLGFSSVCECVCVCVCVSRGISATLTGVQNVAGAQQHCCWLCTCWVMLSSWQRAQLSMCQGETGSYDRGRELTLFLSDWSLLSESLPPLLCSSSHPHYMSGGCSVCAALNEAADETMLLTMYRYYTLSYSSLSCGWGSTGVIITHLTENVNVASELTASFAHFMFLMPFSTRTQFIWNCTFFNLFTFLCNWAVETSLNVTWGFFKCYLGLLTLSKKYFKGKKENMWKCRIEDKLL